MLKSAKRKLVLTLLLSIVLVIAGCGTHQRSMNSSSGAAQAQNTNTPSQKPQETVELTLSAAASMTDALKEIQKAYEAKHPNVKLNFNFGASGALQQQIEQGAPADLFLSAAAKNMKALVDKQLIDASQQKKLLTNELVAVVSSEGTTAVRKAEDLVIADVKHVAIGIPESVPAGSYAKEALTNLKLWDLLQAKLVQAKDVRQVLQYVETGNADVGFVYRTDALTSQKVKVAFVVNPQSYTPVEYPIGIVKATKHSKEAGELYSYLQSKEALDLFVKYGFSVLQP